MRRKYIIVGRKAGHVLWYKIGEKGEPTPKPLTWVPGLDNIAGGIEMLKAQKPGWEFKAVRI